VPGSLGAGAPSSFPFASRSSPARSSCPHHSYKIGDAFLKVPGEEALQLLARDTERVDAQLARLEAQKEQCDAGMQELKVKLYAKFGKENISELWCARRVELAGGRGGRLADKRFSRVIDLER
jgi:hypothetical protein